MSDEPSLSAAQTEETAPVEESTQENTESSSTLLTGSTSSDTSGDTDSEETPEGETGGGSKADDDGQTDAPETYADFNLPEGVEMDESLLAAALPLFKEANLTQEQAQKFIDLQAERVQASVKEQTESFNQLVDGWREQSVNDKEFGGDNLERTMQITQKAMEKYGTPEFKELMNDHGLGNHPEMIRFIFHAGRELVEDRPGVSSAAVSPETDRVQRMYKS
jgi:hypothetical protein